MNKPQREALDLTFKPCRRNFKRSLRWNWNRWWWWKLVLSDTINQVCSRQPKSKEAKGG